MTKDIFTGRTGTHEARLLRYAGRYPVWMVGCSCGRWKADAPLRGPKSRARKAWEDHVNDAEQRALDVLDMLSKAAPQIGRAAT